MELIKCYAKGCHYNQISQHSVEEREPEHGYCTSSKLYIDSEGQCGGPVPRPVPIHDEQIGIRTMKAIIEAIEEMREEAEDENNC